MHLRSKGSRFWSQEHVCGSFAHRTLRGVFWPEISNGRPQTITLSRESSPVSLCTMMNVSTSMETFADEERRIILRVLQQTNRQDDTAVDEMSEAIRGRYRVTYTSTNVDRNGKVRSFEVKPLKTPGSVKANLHAPKGYYAPSQ
jgi:hypothetical protein